MRNLKNIIIFGVIFVAALSAGIVAMVFLAKKGSSVTAPVESEMASLVDPHLPSQEEKSRLNLPELSEKIFHSVIMETDYFSLTLPLSWTKSSEEYVMPMIIVDSLEEITNEKAKKIDFRTGLSINSRPLGESSLKSYVENIKTGLIQTIPIIEITKEEQVEISGSDAYVLEIDSIQFDLNFKTVLVIFADKENNVWAFSFNTLEESWAKYKDVFYYIIHGLQMK